MLANKALNVDAKCKMAACYSGRRYLVEMIARQTVGTLQLSMLMTVCVFRDPDGSKAAPPTAGKSRFICETLHKMRLSCSVKHAKNHFSGREIFPQAFFSFLSFFFLSVLFGPPLPPTCGLKLHVKLHHDKFKHGSCSKPEGEYPLSSRSPQTGHVCFFCQPPSKERCATLVHSDKRN